jgi:hypothetical protein
MELCEEGIFELKKAIVLHTSKDYLKIHRKLHLMDNYGKVYRSGHNKRGETQYYSREHFVDELEEIMVTLYSDWFERLTGVNTNALLDILDKMHDEWKAEYDRKMKEGG